ncbi:hypothetical protein D7030_10995 [Flavobacteriaceae bacterium AU392]|nr:hypothetical protein D1817_13675 [Flavobacteriaceae bacterium]RKM82686.1 hypothetical protein D7030_10995 [Flavobacteriaceae bacterium AU392]
MFQNTLLQELQKALPTNTSLIDAVATALDISYDAAHRRTSLKSKFSLDESIILSKYYNLSLDKLFETSSKNYVALEKTKLIENELDLEQYFKHSHQSLQLLLKDVDSHILYSAKDIPLFYTIGDDLLSRFKIYVWLKLLDSNFKSDNFEQFAPSVSLIQSGKILGNLYDGLNITEIWDITTINSTLKQIHFYFYAGQISTDCALLLCESLHQLINKITCKIKTSPYQLYYNELLLMNNNVLVTTPRQELLYVPFSFLSYFLTGDKLTCKQAKNYFDKQLLHSKLLNTAGEKEQQIFFNKIHNKISALEQLIKATQVLDFE